VQFMRNEDGLVSPPKLMMMMFAILFTTLFSCAFL
jgi:hypothetical protein